MCAECRHIKCPPGCPNFLPHYIGECAYCGEQIQKSEEAVENGDKLYHFDCFQSIALMLLTECGAIPTVANGKEVCAYCGERIEENDESFFYNGNDYHLDCLSDDATNSLVENHGVKIRKDGM